MLMLESSQTKMMLMEIRMSKLFFHGCVKEAGHYLFTEHGNRLNYKATNELGFHSFVLDGALIPKDETKEGICFLSCINGWTIVAFNDRSVDSRMSSNACFLYEGNVPFTIVLAEAKSRMKWFFDRINYGLSLNEKCYDLDRVLRSAR
jgi:hypothetical protein